MAAPLVAVAGKQLAAALAKGAAKKAGDDGSAKRLIGCGCVAAMVAVILPVFVFLALLQALVRGAVQTNPNDCTIPIGNNDSQLTSYLNENGPVIAAAALFDAGIKDQNRLIVMTAIAGAASDFKAGAPGGYWAIPGAPTAMSDPDKGAAMAVAKAGGGSLANLSYFAGNEAYQAFAAAGGVTAGGINWSVAAGVFDSKGYFAQAASAVPYMLTNLNGGCACPDAYGVGGGGGGGGAGGVTLSAKQIGYVKAIIGVAKTMNLGQNAWVIGLITGMQESGFNVYANTNVPSSMGYPHDKVQGGAGAANSIGIFEQQVGSDGSDAFSWGTTAQIMNAQTGPAWTAYAFYRVLVKVSGWQSMQPWDAAQAVQRSAFSGMGTYSKWVGLAHSLISQYGADAPPVPLPAGASGGGPGGGGADAQCAGGGVDGCKNPIHPGLYGPARTDQGVDWLPNGKDTPVYAICPGVVTAAFPGGVGWPGFGSARGGAYFTYKITSGSQAGHCVYVAENITNMKPVGTTFNAGDQIASSQPGYAWTEWGWARCAAPGQYGGPLSQIIRNSNDIQTTSGKAFCRFLQALGAHCLDPPGPGPVYP